MSDQRYLVKVRRDGNRQVVWLRDDRVGSAVGFGFMSQWDGMFHTFHAARCISLNWGWWTSTSPAERIRRAKEKAQAKADKLNARELYFEREAEMAERI